MRPIILDTDPGVDDAMAIAYAHCHPGIELVALTTVFGNTSVDFATRNARYVLEVFGATEVAVARGAAVPSAQAVLPYPEFVHGADGLGNVYPAGEIRLDPGARHSREESMDAAHFIVDAARRRPGEITLVAVGPLTNIAAAIALEPELPGLLSGLVVMGGTLDEPGNVSPLAEANFFSDPHAADAVFAAHWPATVVGLDVTHRIMLADADLDRLGAQGGETGRLIRASSRFYVDFYTSGGAAKGGPAACAMHDAAAIARVLMPDAFGVVEGPVRVVPDGMAAGQLALDRIGREYALPYWNDRPPTAVCVEVDAERVRSDFLETIVRHRLR